MLKSISKGVMVSSHVRGGDNGAELVGMTKNQKKIHKGESHILVVEFFFFFNTCKILVSTSGKDLVTQKGYNQGLDFHDREIFKTYFQQIECGREEKRNKNHVESLCLQKL